MISFLSIIYVAFVVFVVVVVVVVVASVGHLVAAPQRCSVAVWLNSFLIIVFVVTYVVFVVIYVVFVVVVVVASVGHPVAASQRCSVAVLEIQLYCPVCPPSSLLLSSPRNHHHHHYIKQSDACLEKEGLIKEDQRQISTKNSFTSSRSIDLFDDDVACVFDPRYC